MNLIADVINARKAVEAAHASPDNPPVSEAQAAESLIAQVQAILSAHPAALAAAPATPAFDPAGLAARIEAAEKMITDMGQAIADLEKFALDLHKVINTPAPAETETSASGDARS